MSTACEKQRKEFVKRCLNEYYEEDKNILIDSSVCRVYCSRYIISDLIYFGNKILISNEELIKLKNFASDNGNSKWKRIRKKNAQTILNSIAKDTHHNIKIVAMPNGESKVERLENYLKEDPSILLYVQNEKLYQELQEKGVRKQLYLLYEEIEDIGLFHTKYKFETIGAIKLENEKMMIYKREKSKIKVFNSKGREREGSIIEVKQRDFILIKSINEDETKSITLYEIVSRHSRNHASLILRTNLKKDENTNFYIEELPYLLQQIIKN